MTGHGLLGTNPGWKRHRDEPCTCSPSRSRCSSSCSCTSTTWCASCSSSRSARPMPGRPTASTASRCTPSTRSPGPATTSTCRRGPGLDAGEPVADLVVDLRPSAVAASPRPDPARRRVRRGEPRRRAARRAVHAGRPAAPRVDRRRDRGAARRRRGARGPSRARPAPERPLHHRRPVAGRLPVGASGTRWCGPRPSTRSPRPGVLFAQPLGQHRALRAEPGDPPHRACTRRTTGRCSTARRSTPASPTSRSRPRAAGYDPKLFGYTDTSVDPRRCLDDDPRLRTYEGVLPGLRRRCVNDPEETAGSRRVGPLAGRRKGVDVPADPRDLYEPDRSLPGRRRARRELGARPASRPSTPRPRSSIEHLLELARPARRRRAVVRARQLHPAPPAVPQPGRLPRPLHGRATCPTSAATRTARPRGASTRWPAAAIGLPGRRLPDRRARPSPAPAPPTTG